MAKMTKVQCRKYEKFVSVMHETRREVYGNRWNVTLADCLADCDPAIAAAYYDACEAVTVFEAQMVNEHRGYRTNYGMFVRY